MDTLKDLTKRHGIRMTYRRVEAPTSDDWPAGSTHWRCTLRYQGGKYRVSYHMGPACTGTPRLVEVLDSLVSDAYSAYESFDGWCAEYGYDTDSRKAMRTYRACRRIARRLGDLLGPNLVERLALAERT